MARTHSAGNGPAAKAGVTAAIVLAIVASTGCGDPNHSSPSQGIKVTKLWETTLEPFHTAMPSPSGSLVICEGESSIFVFDGNTGRVLWSIRANVDFHSVGTTGDELFVLHRNSNDVVVYESSSGAILRTFPLPQNWRRFLPASQSRDGYFYSGTRGSRIERFSESNGQAEVVIDLERHSDILPSKLDTDYYIRILSVEEGRVLALIQGRLVVIDQAENSIAVTADSYEIQESLSQIDPRAKAPNFLFHRVGSGGELLEIDEDGAIRKTWPIRLDSSRLFRLGRLPGTRLFVGQTLPIVGQAEIVGVFDLETGLSQDLPTRFDFGSKLYSSPGSPVFFVSSPNGDVTAWRVESLPSNTE